jgi:aminopeptidase-like protein
VTAPPGTVREALARLDRAAAGAAMHDLVTRAFPILRSITGDGVRRTLVLGREIAPLEVHEVPSGTPVFDWKVPPEWNVREAWIASPDAGPDGHRVVDLADHTLTLMSYSVPVSARMSRAALDEHLHSLPEQPDLIPYRTSYYREAWGFCLPHRLRESLPDGEYEVVIDSTLDPGGSLTYGELYLPPTAAGGGSADAGDVLVSCHVCHPSLANDNLSGLAVTLWLARELAGVERRHGWRFVWIPGTIGAITWLAQNRDSAARIAHGFVAANLGDPGRFHYKRSRRGDAVIDRAAAHLLAGPGAGGADEPGVIEDFVPFGYDERQYCSPGFDLPVGLLSRTPWGRYPEYHTSADDLGLVLPEALAGSLARCLELAALIEGNRRYRNLEPYCEPELGRRGLYGSVGGGSDGRDRQLALLWVLNLSDGRHDLLAIAERAGLPFARIEEAARALLEAGLLAEETEKPASATGRPDR